jgi:hypothetical protein
MLDQKELATYDDADVAFCDAAGAPHDYRPYTSSRSPYGEERRTYWRCVWCHGVTCGDYAEEDPCWLPYHHRTPHRSRSGETWPLGGEPGGAT